MSEWTEWKGVAVTPEMRDRWAHEIMAEWCAGTTFMARRSGDSMVIAMQDGEGDPVTIYDCLVRRRGDVEPTTEVP